MRVLAERVEHAQELTVGVLRLLFAEDVAMKIKVQTEASGREIVPDEQCQLVLRVSLVDGLDL